MIQRIQSVWLLLASLFAFLTLKFSFYSGTNVNNTPYQQLTASNGGFLILALTLLIGLVSVITIFLFKNRTTQFWLCITAIVAELLLLFLYYGEIKNYTQGTLSLSALFHPAIIVLLGLAARSIYKDEKLVKESDRLR